MNRSPRPAGRLRRSAPIGIVLALAGLLAACTAPAVTPSPSPLPSPSASVPSETPSATPDASATATPTESPSAAPSESASPSASPSSAGLPDCAKADLAISAGPWLGAAGSRGADVTVAAAADRSCRLPAGPVVGLADASGKQLAHSPAPPTGDGPILHPGTSQTFSLLVGNWCDRSARLPLQADLFLAGTTVAIPGLTMAADDLPPCNGPSQPANLSTEGWQ